MFPEAWREETGVLHHVEPVGRLREGIAPVEASALVHPDVRFFLERNPGHGDGDELCCLGRIGLELWGAYSAKLARRVLFRRRRT
jgi:hypothetical protein